MKEMKNLFLKAWRRDKLPVCLFISYIFLLVWVVIFKTRIGLPYVRPERTINLIPFFEEIVQSRNGLSMDAILNVLAFIPMGIYLRMWGCKWHWTILSGFFTSLVFEVTQFSLAIGVADVTDLITNTAGTALGLLLYLLLAGLFRDHARLYKVIKIIATVLTAFALAIFLLFVADEIIWSLGVKWF